MPLTTGNPIGTRDTYVVPEEVDEQDVEIPLNQGLPPQARGVRMRVSIQSTAGAVGLWVFG